MNTKQFYNQCLQSHLLCFDPVNKNLGEAPSFPKDPRLAKNSGLPFAHVPGVRAGEHGVTFTYYAPDADSVELALERMDIRWSLHRQDSGYWSITLDKLAPGQYMAFFFVNGVETLHPRLPIGYDSLGCCAVNYIEVPGDEDFWQLKDVPHGSITMEMFQSSITGRTRNCWVYTPPSYGRANSKRYPVLYIQHGGGQSEASWFWQAKLGNIVDNLLADEKCAEMIIVAQSGYAYAEIGPDHFEQRDFMRIICEECVPLIDDKYRTITSRENRAIAGLSMGGGQARQIAFTHPELFANVGIFSSGAGFEVKGETLGEAFDYSELFASATQYNERMKLTFVACGTDDFREEYTAKQVLPFCEAGYRIEYHRYPSGHDWNVWRRCARDFAMAVFQ